MLLANNSITLVISYSQYLFYSYSDSMSALAISADCEEIDTLVYESIPANRTGILTILAVVYRRTGIYSFVQGF